MKAARTLLIKRPLRKFNEDKRTALVKVLTRVDALSNLWARGYEVYPPDLNSKFAYEFEYFQREVAFNNGRSLPKRWFARVHAMLNVQVRLSNERDKGELVFIDLPEGELRLRGIIKGRAIVVRLSKHELKYIKDRLGEGGKLKLAQAWVDDKFLYIALIFERETVQYTPEAVLSIDVNAIHNGISWALIRDGKIVSKGMEMLDVSKLYKQVVSLERKYGILRRLGLHKTIYGRRLWRQVKAIRRRIHSKIRDRVRFIAHKLIQKALRYHTIVIVDEPDDESIRILLEEGLDNGLAKIHLAGIRRLVRLLEGQANWYGIPLKHTRLYSTICPFDGERMIEVEHRVMRCPKCGFMARRDEVPHYWALKQLQQLAKTHAIQTTR